MLISRCLLHAQLQLINLQNLKSYNPVRAARLTLITLMNLFNFTALETDMPTASFVLSALAAVTHIFLGTLHSFIQALKHPFTHTLVCSWLTLRQACDTATALAASHAHSVSSHTVIFFLYFIINIIITYVNPILQ